MLINPANWNPAQWFMAVMAVLQIGAGPAFMLSGQPVGGSIWLLYGLGGLGWFLLAAGYK